MSFIFFFFNDTATTEIYPLSLHDALPICLLAVLVALVLVAGPLADLVGADLLVVGLHDRARKRSPPLHHRDRKSTRLNSSHGYISYAVFCLKKKKNMRCISRVVTCTIRVT